MIYKLAIAAVFLCALASPALAKPKQDAKAADQPVVKTVDTEPASTKATSTTDTDEELPALEVQLGIPEKNSADTTKVSPDKPVKQDKPVVVAATSRNTNREIATANRHSRLTQEALGFRGTPYVWGGTGRFGFDCSGFTQYLYAKRGVKLPHSAKMQFQKGTPVSKSDLREGDLVFFNTRGPLTHVGMYIGNGRFVHAANRRRGVTVNSLDEAYYVKCYAGARRYT